MSTKPTVLFVHGSWHTSAHFGPVRKIFEEAGYPTSCPTHPSIGQLPPIGLKEDAQCIRDELTKLVVDESKEVIVIGHSYGGVVTTEAVDEAFAKKAREAKGQQGGVIRLVYMCAFLPPLGSSLAGIFGGALPPFIPVAEDGSCYMDNAEHRWYHDLSPEEQKRWIGESKRGPAIAQQTPVTQVAYKYHPVTYLYCDDDQALPFEIQKSMVKGIEDQGVQVTTEQCSAGHSPYLSMPNRVLELVQRIA